MIQWFNKVDIKGFLSRINPFAEKIPEIMTKVSQLSDDKEFQKLLGQMGTIGGLFNIGLYIFDKVLDNLPDNEKAYFFSLINRTAISVAKQIIKEDFVSLLLLV